MAILLFQDVAHCFTPFHLVSGEKNLKNLEKILNVKEVCKLTGLSRTTIWRRQREGSFPTSKKISTHRAGFLSADIDSWIRAVRE
jgi:prophage regulatory protein